MSNARLDELTVKITAFRSWSDFEFAMRSNGYVPTLRPFPGRSKWAKQRTADVIELRRLIQAKGLRVEPETV